jgi:hypothetical protein
MAKVEIFTAGCPLCEPAVQVIREIACPECEVILYDLQKGCETNLCRVKVQQYGIKRVPAIVVDGQLADCCASSPVKAEVLSRAGIGKGK